MGYGELLQQAWNVTWQQRRVWLFGALLALFGGAAGSGGQFNNLNFYISLLSSLTGEMVVEPAFTESLVFVLVNALLALGGLWLLGGLVLRPMMISAVIALVQQAQEGTPLAWGDGWRYAWSRRSWGVFLIEVLVRLPIGALYIGTFCATFLPLLLFTFDSNPVRLLGGVATGGGLIIWALLSFLFGFFVTPFVEICWRFAVLFGHKPSRSLRLAYALLRQRLAAFAGAVGVMLVIDLLGRSLSLFSTGILLSVSFIGTLFVTSLFSDTAFAWIGFLFGLMIVLVGVLPMLLVNGIFWIFHFSLWSLIFKTLNKTTY